MRKTVAMAKRALRIRDAANYLSVSPRRVRSLVQKGALQLIKLDEESQHSPWLIDIRDLDNLVEKSKVTLS
jgi:hypothetical protein